MNPSGDPFGAHRGLPRKFTENMKSSLPTLALLLLLSACSRNSVPGKGGLITERGAFPSPSGAFRLEIGSKSQSLVDYRIVDVATGRESRPDHLFSDAMRWGAFWQADDTLWVHSSDIGLSVWKRDAQGSWVQEWIGGRLEWIPRIPGQVWDFLPSSYKREWAALRKQNSETDLRADENKALPSDSNPTPPAAESRREPLQ